MPSTNNLLYLPKLSVYLGIKIGEFIIETFTLKFYACYLLIGTIIGLLLETVIRATGHDITGWERVSLICGWPVHGIIFVWNFIKGYLGKD